MAACIRTCNKVTYELLTDVIKVANLTFAGGQVCMLAPKGLNCGCEGYVPPPAAVAEAAMVFDANGVLVSTPPVTATSTAGVSNGTCGDEHGFLRASEACCLSSPPCIAVTGSWYRSKTVC